MRGTELEEPRLRGEELAAAACKAARRILSRELPKLINNDAAVPSDLAIATLAAALMRVERGW